MCTLSKYSKPMYSKPMCSKPMPELCQLDAASHGLRTASFAQEAVVGVTTGQLLCACVGSATRSEYTVYGNAINLAARLMGKAAGSSGSLGSLGSVLCDSTTVQLAPKAATYNCLKPQEVCGATA